MKNLIKRFLKYFYRLLILKVIIINKINFVNYNKLKTFCEYELITNMGPIKFIFKEDYRYKKRNINNLFLNSFLIELKIPDNIIPKRQEINDKIIIVITLIIFKINYEILSEVLLDVYIDTILAFIKNNPDGKGQVIQ